MGDDARAALASFYGLALTATPAPVEGETLLGSIAATAPSPAAVPTTTASTVGDGPSSPTTDRANLDSRHFDPDHYVETMLRDKGIKELLAQDRQMIAAKNRLDTEMQELVYQNYEKFISATDMIRKMKSNVEGMEEEMNNLLKNVAAISGSCATIETSLAPSRERIHNLVGVSRLLKRLEFLFELPGRLRKSIQLGGYAQAVKWFRVANRILKQYNHIPSFEKIRVESESIMAELKIILRKAVRDSHASAEQQMETAAMLIDLNEPPDGLLTDVFGTCRIRLQADMQRAVAFAMAEDEKRALEAARPAATTTTTPPPPPEQHDEEKKSSDSLDADDMNELANILMPGRDKAKSDANAAAIAAAAAKADEESVPSLIGALHRYYIDSFAIFAQTYLDTFITPYAGRKGPKGESDGVLEKCTSALGDFTREVFDDYFVVVRKELKERGNLPETVNYPASKQIFHLTRLLKIFYRSITRPNSLVPRARLTDRASEIIEHSIRNCVTTVFQRTEKNILQSMRRLHHQIEVFTTALVEIKEAQATMPDDGAPLPQPSAKQRLPSVAKASKELRVTLEESLKLLGPLLQTGEYLPNTLVESIGDMAHVAHAHFGALANDFTTTITCGVLRESEGPVYAPSAAIRSPLADLSALSDLRPAMYYLFLSQICRHMDKKEIAFAFNKLRDEFPSRRGAQGFLTMDRDMSDAVTQRFRESASLLLQRYVEAHGHQAARYVRQSQDARNNFLLPPIGVRPYVRQIAALIHQVEAELAEIFPAPTATSTTATPSSPAVPATPTSVTGVSATTGVNGGRGGAAGATPARPTAAVGGVAAGRGAAAKVGTTGTRSATTGTRTGAASGGIGGDKSKREIERMFTQRVRIYGGCKANRTTPLFCILKVAFKALMETTRVLIVPPHGYTQIQLEVHTLRTDLPAIFSPDDLKVLYFLLDEVMTAANDRCTSPPVPLDDVSLDRLYKNGMVGR